MISEADARRVAEATPHLPGALKGAIEEGLIDFPALVVTIVQLVERLNRLEATQLLMLEVSAGRLARAACPIAETHAPHLLEDDGAPCSGIR